MNPNDDDIPSADTPGPEGDAPDKPRRRRRPAKAAAATEAGTSAAPSETDASAAPATASAPQSAAADSESGEEPRERSGNRRGRNRRRGRRGAKGSVGEAAAATPAVDVSEVFAEVLSGSFDSEREAAAMAAERDDNDDSDDSKEAIDSEAAVSAEAADDRKGRDEAGGADDPASDANADEADAEEDAATPGADPSRRVLAPDPDAPKLHKVLAQAGVGSRRDLEQMIIDGRVTVNGETAHTGQRISFGDQIRIDDKPVRVRIAPPKARVLAYHKPVGEVVTHDDPQQRPTVFRRLPRLAQGKWQSVGRLDINTEGLLLFTNSGELANQLMHPRFGVEREYAVRSLGVLDAEAIERLTDGVEIEGQMASFKSIEDGGGEGVNHWYRVVITEGRHREVRRLFEAVGHAVSRLIRIRYGSVVLPRGLKRGVWVDLGDADVKALRRIAGGAGGQGEGSSERQGNRPAEGERSGRGRRGRRRGKGEGSEPRPPRGDRGDGGPIPNPLQQTFDKRAGQQARRGSATDDHDDYEDDESHFRSIPNPLQQTYDKSGLQRERQIRERSEDGPIPNPLQQTYDKRHVQKPRPLGGSGHGRGGKKGGGPREPDPMQTAVGYIGGDAFTRKGGRGGRGGRGGGSGGGGGGGGGGRGGRGR